MGDVFVYGISLVISVTVSFISMMLYGVMGGDDITIVSIAMFSAGIALGIVGGRCIIARKFVIHSGRCLLISIACYLIPIISMTCYMALVDSPLKVIALIFKYIQMGFYMIPGFIPGLILKLTDVYLWSKSETAANAVLVVGILVLPVVEAIIVGNLIETKIGIHCSSSADAYLEDSKGNIHRVWFK